MRRIETTPEQQEAARRRYEEGGEAFAAIAPSLNMAARTLRDRAREWGWVMRGRTDAVRRLQAVAQVAALRQILHRLEAPDAPPATPVAAAEPADAVDRPALTGRIRQAVERELAIIERLLDRASGRGPLDSSAKTLATLVRTLAELSRLEAAAPPAPGAAEEDGGPYGDLDDLRRELSRRLAGLRERRAQ